MAIIGENTMFRIWKNDEIIFESDTIQGLIEYIDRDEDWNPEGFTFYPKGS
jgi:GT2 family glycosyltransferase|tara:strand:+ start:707 stop:859 length:153 start_codon:yes stop_codon:yes gene_type:complete